MTRSATTTLLAGIALATSLATAACSGSTAHDPAGRPTSPTSPISPTTSSAAASAPVSQATINGFALDVGQEGDTGDGPYGPPEFLQDLDDMVPPCGEQVAGWPGKPAAWLGSDGLSNTASDNRRLLVYPDAAAARAAYDVLEQASRACTEYVATDRDGSTTTVHLGVREPGVGDDSISSIELDRDPELTGASTGLTVLVGRAVFTINASDDEAGTGFDAQVDERARTLATAICDTDWAGC